MEYQFIENVKLLYQHLWFWQTLQSKIVAEEENKTKQQHKERKK